ncbi:hypothetical protein TrRE_jg2453 [Triparma retinervis]|uniref:SAP domain-containing protein n=1 Tax=Triparma retinervis TaxID=2557542 RepID=A0A9W7E1N8_9STRA|nr:hypothetical protein TrRE_jg2453 [Triparma retinervis]
MAWAKDFGRINLSKNHTIEQVSIPRDHPDYIEVDDLQVKGVLIVTTEDQAKIVLKSLEASLDTGVIHACDTEVMNIDLKSAGPVGNGLVTCLTMYSGPTFDYGIGEPGSALFIDNLDASAGLLGLFKGFFEDQRHHKAWHNYGFDRHVMFNMGIDCKGFRADTMHMARLEDSSRMKFGGGGGGYGLEALTDDILGRRKRPMKEIFGKGRLKKDGTEGAVIEIPPIEDMQRMREHRQKWISYAAYDAEGTWLLREELERRLRRKHWMSDKSLYEFYCRYLVPFGECLTDMERRGVRVDAREYLAGIEVRARADQKAHSKAFREWAATMIGPDGLAINPSSSQQLQTFLFGGSTNAKTKEPFDLMTAVQMKSLCKDLGLKQSGKKSEVQDRLRGHFLSSGEKTSADGFDVMTAEDLKDALVARGLPTNGNKAALIARLREDSAYALELLSEATVASADAPNGYKSVSEALAAAVEGGQPGSNLAAILDDIKGKSTQSKWVDVTISSIFMTPNKFTAAGAPSVTADVLRKLAGEDLDSPRDRKYGTAYEFFGGGPAGHSACKALYSLTQIGSTETMINNFVVPLQVLSDDQGRVHCSLNMNTETGRLSARKPNLQNQPALEKDVYKIRSAFQASPGNKLIVADYGQLELRLLASMTDCTSMIDAFSQGGDFHSRTAMGMFGYIKDSVDKGEVLFEWDYSKGDPPAPMLKDEFGSERRKAKTLNFSIAYGKTAHGLSQDWGVSVGEAEQMLQAWYSDRPEVLRWQKKTKATARREGITRTLMGRYRELPEAMGRDRKLVGHGERASINTPIQGGAADVAMMAMIKINQSPVLRELGWILLLQVHDEVMLEGPASTAPEAYEEVINLMQNPWDVGLPRTKVPLLVDGSFADNWYEAK